MNQVVIPIAVQDIGKARKRRQPKGRQPEPAALAEVQAVLGDAPRRRDLLIEHLHAINDHYGQLAIPHLVALAQEMGLSMAEVYEVATFYHHFDVVREDAHGAIQPPAAVTVRVCEGIACELGGARDLLARLPALLGSEVRVVAAPCIGRCERAPAALVGQNPVDFASVQSVMDTVATRAVHHEPEAHLGYDEYRAQGGYQLLLEVASGKRDTESVLRTMEDSGLRGLGGAGFPTGRKWRIVMAEPAPRLMAVNLDEGEPGTFKDRVYLERDPHRFLEGMLIAAAVTQVSAIYIYLRDEYAGCRAVLGEALRRLHADPPMPGLPEIQLRRGAGAYICGEESAMIESIEGKRGMPRLRPPYVAQVGLFGRPTLEHNFETLYWVREILEKGAGWFAAQGRHGRHGLRSFSVSGRVKLPGVHLAPAGITVSELIEEYCGGMQDGHRFYGYLPGGASGGILPASLGDIPLDFDTLQPYGCFIGSAAIVVFSEQDSAVAVARNLMRFFKHESCGQCTPCRVGTAKALDVIAQPKWDLAALADLSAVMRDASICGLGQAAPNPVDCVIKYFPQELA
ncbi:NADH-ubiquinone oxidoreductase-F iron-sulfur binding region domain-containing protein [Cupriavidus sp. CV2]|uniref:NADH-ubiquinone oxidoreductase-F iron-sulfur binding region domain-containing protein n=1 Tax=Cupriavidus ulmosensis TaxID=3065913 RepID=UPI00296ABFEA|nr:NADH-ubiquinone oxidoreductase-F iron-sulfur binding region domain-containing protein [Cupriavidus sp. CV2]MDW3680575.1 NADH-ubiquinone oxidoreductase-F iron-sulfur binding region domain-containing protein [Cupriavidus sp. CV2]